MGTGLQIFNAAGALTFDSSTASGGICVGIKQIPAEGATYSYPAFTGRIGVAIYSEFHSGYDSVDYALGYPRFTLPSAAYPYRVALFIK